MLTAIRCPCTIIRCLGNQQRTTTKSLLFVGGTGGVLRRRSNVTQHTRCPYQALGVPRTASLEEIKEAYLTKAKQHHPDANPGAGDAVHDKFSEISDAYAYLTSKPDPTNPATRSSAYTYNKRYYGHDWWEEEKEQQFRRPTGKPFENARPHAHSFKMSSIIGWGVFINFVIIPFIWFDPFYLWSEDEDDWSYGPLPDSGARFVQNRDTRVKMPIVRGVKKERQPEGPRWDDEPRDQNGKKIKKIAEV